MYRGNLPGTPFLPTWQDQDVRGLGPAGGEKRMAEGFFHGVSMRKIYVLTTVRESGRDLNPVSWRFRDTPGKMKVVGYLRYVEGRELVLLPKEILSGRLLWSVLRKVADKNRKNGIHDESRIGIDGDFLLSDGKEFGRVVKIGEGAFAGQYGVVSNRMTERQIQFAYSHLNRLNGIRGSGGEFVGDEKLSKVLSEPNLLLTPAQAVDIEIEVRWDGFEHSVYYQRSYIGKFWKDGRGEWMIEPVPGIYRRAVIGAFSRASYVVDKLAKEREENAK